MKMSPHLKMHFFFLSSGGGSIDFSVRCVVRLTATYDTLRCAVYSEALLNSHTGARRVTL